MTWSVSSPGTWALNSSQISTTDSCWQQFTGCFSIIIIIIIESCEKLPFKWRACWLLTLGWMLGRCLIAFLPDIFKSHMQNIHCQDYDHYSWLLLVSGQYNEPAVCHSETVFFIDYRHSNNLLLFAKSCEYVKILTYSVRILRCTLTLVSPKNKTFIAAGLSRRAHFFHWLLRWDLPRYSCASVSDLLHL